MNVLIPLLQYDSLYQFILYAKRKFIFLYTNQQQQQSIIPPASPVNDWIDISQPPVTSGIIKQSWLQRLFYYLLISIVLWHWQIVVWRDSQYAWLFSLPPIVDFIIRSKPFQLTYTRTTQVLVQYCFDSSCDMISTTLNTCNREFLGIHAYISPEDISKGFPKWSAERRVDLLRIAAVGLLYDYLQQCWNWMRFQPVAEPSLQLYRTEIETILYDKNMERLATPKILSRLISLFHHTDHQFIYQRLQRNARYMVEQLLRWSTYWSFCLFLTTRWQHPITPLVCTFVLIHVFENSCRERAMELFRSHSPILAFRVCVELLLGIGWFASFPSLVILCWLNCPPSVFEHGYHYTLHLGSHSRTMALQFIERYDLKQLIQCLSGDPTEWRQRIMRLTMVSRFVLFYTMVWIWWCFGNVEHLCTIVLLHVLYLFTYVAYLDETRIALPEPVSYVAQDGSLLLPPSNEVTAKWIEAEADGNEWETSSDEDDLLPAQPKQRTQPVVVEETRIFTDTTRSMLSVLRDSYYIAKKNITPLYKFE